MGTWDVTGKIVEKIAYNVYKLAKKRKGSDLEEYVYCSLSVKAPDDLFEKLMGNTFSWTILKNYHEKEYLEQLVANENELDFLSRGYIFLEIDDIKSACECFALHMRYYDENEIEKNDELHSILLKSKNKFIQNGFFDKAIEASSFLLEYYNSEQNASLYFERGDLFYLVKNYNAAMNDYAKAKDISSQWGNIDDISVGRGKFLSECYEKIGNIYQRWANSSYIKAASALGGTDILGVSREVLPLAEKFKEENDFESEYEAYETILDSAYEYDEADKDLVNDIRAKMEVAKGKIKS